MPESTEQMHERLAGVIAAARFEALSQPYAWQQVSKLSQLPATALAAVRDGSTWYALAAVTPEAAGAYRIMVFHFAEGSNASGSTHNSGGADNTQKGVSGAVVVAVSGRGMRFYRPSMRRP